MSNIPLTHLYNLTLHSDKVIPMILREFADNNAAFIALPDSVLKRMMTDPQFALSLEGWFGDFPVEILECHGLWHNGYDLNFSNFPRRNGMIADHKLAMDYAAMFGCRTYTVHVGAYDCYVPKRNKTIEQMRQLAVETLEELIPHAEKRGIIIAVENGTEPTNTPDELVYYMDCFKHPNLGCCLDVGHMNCMAKKQNSAPSKYDGAMLRCWNHNIVEQEHCFDKLAPHIVTCHIHDNDGYHDDHDLPGNGTIDWQTLIPRIKKECPRLISLQSEVAPSHTSIRRLCETFDRIKQL